MDSFLKESLQKARDRHASITQWTWIVLAMLFLAHVLFYSRFLDIRNGLAAARQQERILEEIESRAKRLEENHSQLNQVLEEQVQQITSEDIVKRTVRAFDQLSFRVLPLLNAERLGLPRPPTLPSIPGGTEVSGSTTGSGGDGGAIFPGPPGIGMLRPPSEIPGSVFPPESNAFFADSSSMAMQAPRDALQRGPTSGGIETPLLPPFSEELVHALQNIASRKELHEILRTYVNDHIVSPNFAAANLRLNQLIQSRILPSLEENLAILKELETVGSRWTSAKVPDSEHNWPNWQQMRQSTERAKELAQNTRLEPPANDNWWDSVTHKEATARILTVNTTLALQHPTGPDIERLAETLRIFRREQDQARQELDLKMKAVEQAYAQIRQTATSLDSSLGVVFLDIESFVLGFPMILAVAFSTGVVSTAARLRTMKIIHQLLVQSTPEAEAWKPALGLVPLDRRTILRRTLAIAFAGMAWIGVAWIQLYMSMGGSGWDGAMFVLALALIVSACSLRYYWEIKGVRTLFLGDRADGG